MNSGNEHSGSQQQSSSVSFSQVSEIATAISVMTAAAAVSYFIGWLEVSTYFGTLGASWLIDEASPVYFLKRGGFTLLPVLLLIPISFLLFSSGDWLVKKISTVFNYVLAVNLVLLVSTSTIIGITTFLPTIPGSRSMSFLAGATAVAWICLAGTLGLILVIQQRIKYEFHDRRHIYATVALVLLGIFAVPMSLGQTQALRQRDPVRSTLPSIVLRDSGNKARSLRAVLTTDKRVYALDLEGLGDSLDVFVFPWEQVILFRGGDKRGLGF